jgi:demethylmenaquinone methyltransferase / 2-methoxy-6-polyprenyl-1,4-benzoquinol methylase
MDSIFNPIAVNYDRLNHVLSLGMDTLWRRALVRSIQSPPKMILDGCTGTADLALLLANRFPSSSITGIDLSEEMLRVGMEKIQKKNLHGRIALVSADLLDLPWDGEIYELITISFGIRNIETKEDALRELFRTAKPGCRIKILEFTSKPRGPGKRIKSWYIRKMVPLIGGMVTGSQKSYRHLVDSINRFPDPENVRNLMEKAGWKETEYRFLFPGVSVLYGGVKK